MKKYMGYRYHEIFYTNKPLKEDMENLYQLPLSIRDES